MAQVPWKRLGFLVAALLFVTGIAVAATISQVEIFSWWTGVGEEEGLQALIKVFQRRAPGIAITNATVAGGGGINAKAVLQSRMVGETPPDSFQVHGGAELIHSYVKTGMMEPVTSLLEQWGIRKRFNPKIMELCSYGGEIYSIPLNVHRGNVLWYNRALLSKHQIRPPDSLDSLFKACATLKKAGVIPLALGDRNKWEATHLFETLLAMTLGPARYNGLWNGTTPFDDPGLRTSLERFKQLTRYANPNHAALTWQDAIRMVYEGKAAFNVMGDWAEGYFKTLGWQPGKEFGWTALCGPGGNFMVITDTFGLPKGAPHRSGAVAWLKLIASLEGQDTFNPIKGAIPSRLDANRARYDVYLRKSMDDFARLTLTPSIAHGSAASQVFSGALDDLLGSYLADGDTDRAVKNIQLAARLYLK
ncbi:carbohydrate ABC transporter substrate-binding protein (CUT1 family) [Hydrogenispora ethanolica]|uniref:Probable sugar-binding periplasmic protein n=1 Tax=Hydrogenispora ethanolica TaxID=1082276 RepID=A0A4R1QM20_HYDET|nr:ABC transporter substrate-binding protein [Hydrogenispora ethanolica]TCL54759.1 carbohydrate ABC transporter substrate-binding protein (CUT1 family) [Hydrogenispora ethanolica]